MEVPTKLYIIQTEDNSEAVLHGPYATEIDRQKAFGKLNDEDYAFLLDVKHDDPTSEINVELFEVGNEEADKLRELYGDDEADNED